MALTDLKSLAVGMYVSKQPDVQCHLILLAIKTWTYLSKYTTMAVLRALFNMTNEELEPHIRKLVNKGWIVRNDQGYLQVTKSGDPEYRRIKMKIASYLNEIEKAKRTKE